MTVTGIFLFLSPSGRVASDTNWTMLGQSRETWTNLHILFSLLFLIAAVFHLVWNRKAIFFFLKTRRPTGEIQWEWIMAIILSTALCAATFAQVWPASAVVDMRAYFKRGAVKAEGGRHGGRGNRGERGMAAATKDVNAQRKPSAEASAQTLSDFADSEGLDLSRLIKVLGARGFDVQPGSTMADIAAAGDMTVAELKDKIIGR